MKTPRLEAGSFRDPSGSVLIGEDRVFRTVMPSAVEDYVMVRNTGILETLSSEGMVIQEKPVTEKEFRSFAKAAALVVEHPKLPFISYPYEWCFSALKDAALLHLDIHMRCLEQGVTLSDATAYNVQFEGPKPVFIDTLSFRPYKEDEIWSAHRQFCEQFLNPLLLQSVLGIPHNAWFRGNLEGIPVEYIARALPLKAKFSWNVVQHVLLQTAFQKSSTKKRPSGKLKEIKLPKVAFRSMLKGLRKFIYSLEATGQAKTTWSEYAEDNSYSDEEAVQKADFVKRFSISVKPRVLWDLGCNTGNYSKVALTNGTNTAIGFDYDFGALERAYQRAKAEGLNLFPVHLDAANPAPSQGWAQQERKGLKERASADAVFALALVHHLAIAKNIPLEYVVDWIVGMAPNGIIEFVQKQDPMVQELLRFREDIFPFYDEGIFEGILAERAKICAKERVSSTGRMLYWFERI